MEARLSDRRERALTRAEPRPARPPALRLPRGPTAVAWLVPTVLGCSAPDPAPAPEPGPDCALLLAAAARARACDPALELAAEQLASAPDEAECRAAVRSFIAAAGPSRVRSLHGPDPAAEPLRADERARVAALPLPGRVRLVPDQAPRPGVPRTRATLDGVPVAPAPAPDGERGALLAHAAPGPHTLELQHAERSQQYCLELRACEELQFTTHAAQLPKSPAVTPGACATGPAAPELP